MTPALSVTSAGAVVTLTLDRPESQNTITDELLEALHYQLEVAEADPACRAVVLQGRDRVFCTGMDLAEAAGEASTESAVRSAGRFYDLMARCTTSRLVVIAVVDGRAVGGGVGLVAASDFALATPRSQFWLPEALWGLLPCCVFPFLVRRVGPRRSAAMALGTLPVSGRRAAEIGLVDELAEDPTGPLQRLLARITKLQPATVNALKRYAAQFDPLPDDARRLAVGEFQALTSSRGVQDALDRYLRHGLHPWEPH